MKSWLISILLIFCSVCCFSQIIGKTTISDLRSELKVDPDVEKFDVAYTEEGLVFKALYKDGDRRDFCFKSGVLYCRKIYIVQDGVVWKLKGFEGSDEILALISTDDFARTWLVYLGLPKTEY